MLDNLGNLQRTHSCGALRPDDVGKLVTLMGWVAKRRDFGELTFLDLRDRDGVTQVVLNSEDAPEAFAFGGEIPAKQAQQEHTGEEDDFVGVHCRNDE